MKKFYSFLLVGLLFLQFASAQVKILFDATKAEMAANADWVIDADLHNLGYNSSGIMVTGSDSYHTDSNPQQFPNPSQSTITSTSAEDTWDGAISAWGIDMVKKGYQVETLPYNGFITYGNSSNAQDLSHYKVFVVDEPNIKFTTAEKTAIMNFVQNGGGLFIVSDHADSDRNGDGWDSQQIWKDFMINNPVQTDPFGISVDSANFSGTYSYIANLPSDSILHGVMGNVTKVQWSNGTSFTLNSSHNSSVKGLIYKTSSTTGSANVLAARATYGNGKIFVLGDSSPTDDGTGDPNDQLYDGWIADANGNHEKLIVNATIWLAASSTLNENDISMGLTVSVYPNPASTSLYVKTNSDVNYSIYDLVGNKVKTNFKNESSGMLIIDISNLQNGIYFFVTESGDKKMYKKFTVLR